MSFLKNRALFLDRDGVINVERSYVHYREAFQFQEGIFDLCREAQNLGYLLVVVTNQAGIARGFYTESEFLELTEWMVREFARRGITIAHVYYCPYHPIHGIGRYKYDSPDRKPKPGMLLRAQMDFNLDLTSSVLIGDTISDISAAKAAGVGTTILFCPRVHGNTMEDDHCYISDSLVDIRKRFFSITLRGTS